MSRKLHVNSIEALQHLEKILGMFAGKTSETLDTIDRDMRRKLDWLEDRCRDLRAEAIRWEEAYESADPDEDDIDYLAYKRDEAIAKMQQARRMQKRVETSHADYERCARRVGEISSERLAAARVFLRQKIAELQNYVGFQISAGNLSSGGIGNAIFDVMENLVEANLRTIENAVDNLLNIPLPKGFSWVRFDEINPLEIADLPAENEYKKVSYETMKRGFEILQAEVLPILKSTGATVNDNYFYDFDRQNNRDLADSTEEIFKIFFGDSEPICLDRNPNQAFLNITSGRHRIRVARDLGWTAIPAKII